MKETRKIVTMFKNQEKFKSLSQLKKDYHLVFSWFIRTRDEWKCQRCGTQYAPPTKSLQNSHYENRGTLATAFDQDNCMAACEGCHNWHLERKKHEGGEYQQIMIKRLGDERWKHLNNKILMSKHLSTKFCRSDYQFMIASTIKDLKEIAQYSPYKEVILKFISKFGGYSHD